MVSGCELLVGFRTCSCEGAIMVLVWPCEGWCCVSLYRANVLSCVVLGSSIGLYDVVS